MHRTSRLVVLAAVAAAAAALASRTSVAGPVFSITDLDYRVATSINDAGVVSGFVRPQDGNGNPLTPYVFSYASAGPDAGTVRDLGNLAAYVPSNPNVYGSNAADPTANAFDPAGMTRSLDLKANASGVVAGTYLNSDGTGTPTVFNGTSPGQTVSPATGYASGINANGQVAGTSGYSNTAFLATTSGSTDLGTVPGGLTSVAHAINSVGWVVGEAVVPSPLGGSAVHAFLSAAGQLYDITPAGAFRDAAYAVNDSGSIAQIVYQYSGSKPEVYVDDATGNHSVATLNGFSRIEAMNNLNQIVGFTYVNQADPALPQVEHAFLISGGKFYDLNSLISPSSGLTLLDATSINNLGQITVLAVDQNGMDHSLILTPSFLPTPPEAPYVPEPTSLAVFALGAAFGLRRKYLRGRAA